MNNEELDKRIEFIIEQQAHFSADIQQLRELHTQADARMTRMESIVLRLYEDTDAKFNALVDSQIRLMDSQTRLTEAQVRTDEGLNAFITVVERYISNDGNEKP